MALNFLRVLNLSRSIGSMSRRQGPYKVARNPSSRIFSSEMPSSEYHRGICHRGIFISRCQLGISSRYLSSRIFFISRCQLGISLRNLSSHKLLYRVAQLVAEFYHRGINRHGIYRRGSFPIVVYRKIYWTETGTQKKIIIVQQYLPIFRLFLFLFFVFILIFFIIYFFLFL